MNALAELRQRFAVALDGLAEDPLKLAEMVVPNQDAKLGDYQANCAMPLGKQIGTPPREVAEKIVERLAAAPGWESLCETPEIAGPGFINLRLTGGWLKEGLQRASRNGEQLGVQPATRPRRYVIDYSSPNVAKPMHVGHIRSTVIGDALCQVLRCLGHEVISDNHIGDWGTQFGMIIYGYKNFVDESALAAAPVAELSRLYKLVNQIGDHQSTVAEKIPALNEKIAQQATRVDELQSAPEPDDPKKAKASCQKVAPNRRWFRQISRKSSLRSKRRSHRLKPIRLLQSSPTSTPTSAHRHSTRQPSSTLATQRTSVSGSGSCPLAWTRYS